MNKPSVNSIEWKVDRKLEWGDFKGPVDSNLIANLPKQSGIRVDSNRTTYFHVETEALCFQEYQFSMNGLGDSITYVLKNMFNTLKSWRRTNSEYVLNHEQRHFDLAEVYARKFRKFLQDSINTSNQTILNSYFKKFTNEESAAQITYDSLTQHSVNTEWQTKYNNEIDSLLLVYDAFKSSKIKKKWGRTN